jgi:hypothetical protein
VSRKGDRLRIDNAVCSFHGNVHLRRVNRLSCTAVMLSEWHPGRGAAMSAPQPRTSKVLCGTLFRILGCRLWLNHIQAVASLAIGHVLYGVEGISSIAVFDKTAHSYPPYDNASTQLAPTLREHTFSCHPRDESWTESIILMDDRRNRAVQVREFSVLVCKAEL